MTGLLAPDESECLMHTLAMLVATLVAPLYGQEDEATRASRGMEKKLLEAKTLHLTFAMTIEIDKNSDKLSGQVWLAEDNKARMNIKGTIGGKQVEMTMVSDGKRMLAKVNGVADQGVHDTPRGAGELMRGTIGRAGVFAGVFYGVKDTQEPRLDDLFKVTGFKIAGREKSGNHDCLVLEYKILFRGASDPGNLKVWIDSQSLLPVQRVFTTSDQGKTVRVLEVYGELTTDAKIDPQLFELPKK
jgi:outer membrane lipoprotein-sorting protein